MNIPRRTTPHPKVLIVEGKEERMVIPHLIEQNGVQWGKDESTYIVNIIETGGIEALLERGFIEAELKASNRWATGIIIDADDNSRRNWERVRNRCLGRFPNVPAIPDADGSIVINDDDKRLGIWVMPDNQSHGMLESFLLRLTPPGGDTLLDFASVSTQLSRGHGATFKDCHDDKARIHTWLSWQDPPGKQLHQAIISRVLDPTSPTSQPFVRWFRALFQV